MSTAKMRIKMGPIEIEYEGSEEFLKKELPDLLSAVSKLYQDSGIPETEPRDSSSRTAALTGVGGRSTTPMTVTTVAAKLGCKSGTELIIAAAARLTRDGFPTFSRQKLHDEMKTATGYYKKSFGSNLTNYLSTLVKEQKLQETAADTYSLSINTKHEIEAKLAT